MVVNFNTETNLAANWPCPPEARQHSYGTCNPMALLIPPNDLSKDYLVCYRSDPVCILHPKSECATKNDTHFRKLLVTYI